MTTDSEDQFRAANRLAGRLGEQLTEGIFGRGYVRFGAETWSVLDAEDLPGTREDDLILRDANGDLWNVEIEVLASPRRPTVQPAGPPVPEVNPDQMTIDQAATA